MTPHRGLWAISKEIPIIKAELRAKIGKLTYIDVRRHRLDIYNALKREILEDGCTKAATYFQWLVDKEKHLIETRIINKKVIESDGLLVAMVDNARFAEKLCQLNGDRAHSLIVIFQTALLVEARGDEYNWLTKEIYLISNNLLDEWKHPHPFNEIEARTKYYFGKFLLKRVKNYVGAIEEFTIALDLCRGKQWYTNYETSSILHLKTIKNLAKAYLREADRIQKKDLVLTEQLALKAITVLSEAGDNKDKVLYCEANLRRGYYLICCKKFEQTLKQHKKVKAYVYMTGNPEYKCEMFLQEGICLLSQNNYSLALRKLKQSVRLCEIYGYKSIQGHALMHMGKLYSKDHKTFPRAQNYLNEAGRIFNEIKDLSNVKKVNYLKAVIKTQDIMPELLEIVEQSNENYCEMLRLRAWKDQARRFWTERDDDDDENLTVETSLMSHSPAPTKKEDEKGITDTIEKETIKEVEPDEEEPNKEEEPVEKDLDEKELDEKDTGKEIPDENQIEENEVEEEEQDETETQREVHLCIFDDMDIANSEQ